MDARQRRSRENLRRAILSLASRTSANEIPAGDVAALATVNRSTFYEHASSPTALLEDVLREELDTLRAEYLAGASADTAASAIAGVTRAVLVHVEQHRDVYLLGLDENSGPASLHPMLAAHFEASIRLLVEQRSITFERLDDAAGELRTEMAIRMIADGSVGAILSWLRAPGPQSVDEFVEIYGRLLPGWFPFAA